MASSKSRNTSTANTGTNAQYSYQLASVPRTGIVSVYPTLSTPGQQQIAAQGATTDLSDAITESNLQTLGTMRANEIQREQDIENLESAKARAYEFAENFPGQYVIVDSATGERTFIPEKQ